MSKINIHRGTFLEKEELTRMFSFLNERPEISALLSYSESFGLVSPGGKAGKPFSVKASSTTNAVDIAGGYVIDSTYHSYKVNDTTAFPIPNDGKYYWIKVGAFSRNYEDGYVQVDNSGNVSGTVSFTDVVRGQSSGVPTCIRFVKDDGTQPLNNGVYQVVNIIDDNNIVLSSGVLFQPETQLRVLVLGSIPMGRRFTDEQLEGLYTFDSYQISLVLETVEGTYPDKEENEYYIARVQNNGGVITVLDEREEFWVFGDGGATPPEPTKQFTFTINPTPSDATVTLNGQNRNSITVNAGASISWTVFKLGYVTQSGHLVLTEDRTLDIVLEESSPEPTPQYTLTVATQSGDTSYGTVAINSNTSGVSDSIIVQQGTMVTLTALAAENYIFSNWLKNGSPIAGNAVMEVAVTSNVNYIAVFSEDPNAEYWDFNVRLSEGSNEYELFSVPAQNGSGEYEGVMVRVTN